MGDTEEISPYAHLSLEQRESLRTNMIKAIIADETNFVFGLKSFAHEVVGPIELRDTPFKRSFLADPVVAVSINLLMEIQKACSDFLSAIVQSETEQGIADAYKYFSPSLQLFAQYATQNSKFLNVIEKNIRNLTPFISADLNLESTIISPLEHYSTYRVNFREYFWLIPGDHPDFPLVEESLKAVTIQVEQIDIKLKDEIESLVVLNLQSQCKLFFSTIFFSNNQPLFVFLQLVSGNPAIFTPTRRLLKEVEIEKVRVKKGGEMETKAMVAHIFNDVFIYSRRNVTGGFKLQQMIFFDNANFSRHDLVGMSLSFSLMYPDPASSGLAMTGSSTVSVRMNQMKTETFRLLIDREEEAAEIFVLMTKAIQTVKDRKAQDDADAIQAAQNVNNANNIVIQGVTKESLGPRMQLVHAFLIDEMRFAEQIFLMNQIMVQPLLDASKGAALKIPAPKGSAIKVVATEETLTKYQISAITEALQEADIMIFLRAVEQIAIACKEFVKALESLCNSNRWIEGTTVGNFFTSVSAKSLYNQYKLYTTGQQALLRVVTRNNNFQIFRKEVEGYLQAIIPGTFAEKLDIGRQRIPKYTETLRSLQQVTIKDHADVKPIATSLQVLFSIEQELEELQRLKENFEKLLEIQYSIVTISNEPVIAKLASMDRELLLVQDLKKVCRKKNKVFRFWLFHDYLIYGGALGNEKYSFNRALELVKCSVVKSNQMQFSFEIYGAEKSFVVIAPDQESCDDWLKAMSTACDNMKKAAGLPTSAESGKEAEVAPLWQPDHNSDNCTQCNKVKFTTKKK